MLSTRETWGCGTSKEHPNTTKLPSPAPRHPSQCFSIKFPQPEPPALSAGGSWTGTHGHARPDQPRELLQGLSWLGHEFIPPKPPPAAFLALVPSRTPLSSALLCKEPPWGGRGAGQHPEVAGARGAARSGALLAAAGTAPPAARSVCGSQRGPWRRPGSLSAFNTREETKAPRGKTTCPHLLNILGSAANVLTSAWASARSRRRSSLGFADFDPPESRGN